MAENRLRWKTGCDRRIQVTLLFSSLPERRFNIIYTYISYIVFFLADFTSCSYHGGASLSLMNQGQNA
jgi:hypothetical protein